MKHQIRLVTFDQTMVEALIAIKEGLFDLDVDPVQARAFLDDPRHMIIVAYVGKQDVGMVTAVEMYHPDKQPALFINELGVRDEWLRQGIGTQLMEAMIALGRERGCKGVWLGTEHDNDAALGLYRSMKAQEMSFVGFAWDGAFGDP